MTHSEHGKSEKKTGPDRFRGRLALRAVAPDAPEFLKALKEEKLLTSGLDGPGCANFALVDKHGGQVAFAGYTLRGEVGLLRSCVVRREHRRRGVGQRLVTALLAQMQSIGIARVYLFSETAADFFAALGFRHISRATAPDPIRALDQYTKHCGDDAALMALPLHGIMSEFVEGDDQGDKPLS
ncbi:MAG TPA: GNAT family N-acetyltransferase [Rhodobacteraceae bacterium]|nr:GNAT family N-acetyltransferase [Paracoccaceae bacterium]